MSVSRGPTKQKKKRNSVVSRPATPNTSESSIPSVDKQQENAVDEPLTGHEIESLLLRENDLAKLTYRKLPSQRLHDTRRILVKKSESSDNLQSNNRKNIAVLRPLPPEAHVSSTRILGSVKPGPRYTDGDGLVPHSILGSVDEFTRSQSTTKQVGPSASEFSQSPVIFMPGTDSPQQRNKTPPSTQANALLHWEKRMGDRSRLQDKVARSVHTAPGALAMHRGDHYRSKQEEREMIDRLIPTVDGGKGIYKGGEFWRPAERIGDDLTGIRTTLTKTQQGQPPDLEHVTASEMIKEEMSIAHLSPSTWGDSQYLNYRRQMLSQTMPASSMIGHSSCSQLQVTGQTFSSCTHHSAAPLRSPSLDSLGGDHYSSSDDLNVDEDYDGGISGNILDSQPDVISHPLVGPALRVADQLLTWDQEDEMETAPHVRVLFEADVTKLVSSYLCMQNCGTTAIRYSWEHVQRTNPLGTKQAGTTQRFYFDTRTGVLRPGQKLSLQFMFKSVLPGIFIDQWRMETEPALCGGRPLLIILRGVAVQDDINWGKRQNIDMLLGHRMACSVASNVLERVVTGVATPTRTLSPDPLLKTEEADFLEKNTGVFYHHNIIEQLKMLYVDIVRPPPIDLQASDVHEAPSKAATKKSEEKEKKGGGKKKEEKKGKQQTKEEASKDAAPQEKVVFVFPPDLDPWDLSLLTLQQLAMNMEDDNSREDKLKRLSAAVDALSLPPQPLHSLNSFTKSYMLLCDVIDQLSGTATHLRHIMGLPTREHSGLTDTSSAGGTEELAPRPPSQPTSPAHGGKKEKKAGKKDAKEKETKSGKKKEDTSVQKKKSSKSVNKNITPPESTTDVREAAPAVEVNPVLEAKYRENLQAAVYQILGTAVETMAELMEQLD